MTEIMRLSKQYAPTLKEDPTDAEIASHRLLVRAGMIRKVTSGVYTYLPLGMKVLAKIERIVREEMDATGAREMLMPALQPGELWHESGRWNDYGPDFSSWWEKWAAGGTFSPKSPIGANKDKEHPRPLKAIATNIACHCHSQCPH